MKMKGAEVALGQKTQARRRVSLAGRREYHAGGKFKRYFSVATHSAAVVGEDANNGQKICFGQTAI